MPRLRRRLSRTIMVLLAVGSMGLLAACGSASTGTAQNSAAGPPVKGGTLKIALNADPATLDWTSTSAVVTRAVSWNIFEQLFALDKNYVERPMLAQSAKVSPDKLTYTIKLRTGVKFQDGSDFDSADVVASLERWGKVSGTGVETFQHVKSVTAEGPDTVQIKLKSLFGPLLIDLADVRQAAIMLPSAIANAAGVNALEDKQIIGTGPYELESRTPGSSIVLKRFDQYKSLTENWGGLAGAKAAYFDKLDYQIVTDPQVRINGVQTGEYQFAVNVPQDNYDQVKTMPTVQPFIVDPYAFLAFVFNKQSGPFNNVLLRQAAQYASNPSEIGAAAVGNKALYSLDGSIFFPQQAALHTLTGTSLYNDQNIAKAKQLVTQGGYDGKPIRLLTTKDYPEFYNATVALSSELEAVGFKVDIQVYDWPTLLQRRDIASDYDIFVTTSSPSFDPTSMLWMIPGGWSGFYTSPKMDSLLAQWVKTSDPAVKTDLLGQMNETVYTEVPEIKSATLSALYVASKNLQGYPNWMDTTFWNAWMTKN
ncbi:MAG: hypothetical protein JWR35_3526 [Marmoricola sp.]|jgi:peptide/nickel transport system substrate-binding protein|nr:hypothetical protein [Marmoricola sp.]